MSNENFCLRPKMVNHPEPLPAELNVGLKLYWQLNTLCTLHRTAENQHRNWFTTLHQACLSLSLFILP